MDTRVVSDSMADALREEKEEINLLYENAISAVEALRIGTATEDEILSSPTRRTRANEHVVLDAMEKPKAVSPELWTLMFDLVGSQRNSRSTAWYVQQVKKDSRFRDHKSAALRNTIGKALRVFLEYGYADRESNGLEALWKRA